MAEDTDYLNHSSSSVSFLKDLNGVGQSHFEVASAIHKLRHDFGSLMKNRHAWAQSAAAIDPFLLMSEQGVTSIDFPAEAMPETLLSPKNEGHIEPPTELTEGVRR